MDLESDRDRARLAVPELYLAGQQDKLVTLDEVHRAPALFPVLRGLIDRTSGGAEVDLLLHLPGGALWAVEVKRSLAPKLQRGFHAACEDLQPQRRLVVYPGRDSFPMAHGVQAMPLAGACSDLGGLQAGRG